jgi:hypothetical protein
VRSVASRCSSAYLEFVALLHGLPSAIPSLLWLWLCTAGCGGETKSDTAPQSCTADNQCSPSEECLFAPAKQELPVVIKPCVSVTSCEADADCGAGTVCAPHPPRPPGACPIKVCIESCQTKACRDGEVCAKSGLCELQSCSESGAPGCDEHYKCDPDAAATSTIGLLVGTSVIETVDPTRAAERGCVRKGCDEDGGFTCQAGWTCAPDRVDTAPGCIPDPCEEFGRCQNDATHICQPTSSNPRSDGADPHGCIVRNCDEGYACRLLWNGENFSYCDFSDETADAYGCAVRTCEEGPEVCGPGHVCDAAYREIHRVGCRPLDCRDPGGPPCVEPLQCMPSSAASSVYSCTISPPPPNSGAAGASAGGGAPSSSGAAGASAGGGAPPIGIPPSTNGGGGASTGRDPGVCVGRD